jgi:hypothetical protein
MTCPTCELLTKFERCTKADAIEYYADLMLAHEHVRPRWSRVNAILAFRFGEDGLQSIQQAAKHIIQGLPA